MILLEENGGMGNTYKKVRNSFIFWVVLLSAVQIIILAALGMSCGFGQAEAADENGYPLIFLLLLFLCREIIRGCAAVFAKRRNSRTLLLLISLAAAAADWNLIFYIMLNGDDLKAAHILPYICKALLMSAVLTYSVWYAGILPGILYCCFSELTLVLFPALVFSEWGVLFIRIVFLLLLLSQMRADAGEFCGKKKDEKDRFARKVSTAGTIFLIAVSCLAYPFMMGKFSIYPVAVASGSMEPELMVGDMAVISRDAADELHEGDIIQFKSSAGTTMHRILSITYSADGPVYITKGDNNTSPDSDELHPDDILGKVIFHVPFLGFFTLWKNGIV